MSDDEMRKGRGCFYGMLCQKYCYDQFKMVTCTLFSAEGVVLFTKSVDSLAFDNQECQNIAKYCVMSINIWPSDRNFQHLDLGESFVWVLKLRLDENCSYFVNILKRADEQIPNGLTNSGMSSDSLMFLVGILW